MRILVRGLITAAFVVAISVGYGSATNAQAGSAVIVVLKDGAQPAAVAAEHAARYGAQISFVYTSALNGYAARVPSQALAALANDPRVDFISEDREVQALPKPPQPPGQQKPKPTPTPTPVPTPTPEPSPDQLPTGVARIGANAATTGSAPAVAVVDTGSGPHSDLNVVGGKNCQVSGSYDDQNGHGTHVAGTIAARANNGGVVGVLPGAPIYSVRVLSASGSGTWSQVICGIDWVTANASALGIKVASMSLGGSGSDDGNCGNSNADAMHKAICNSVGAGVTYVVAAGNSATDMSTFVPAAYNEVLTVTAMSDSDGKAGGTGGSPTCRTGESDDAFATFSNYATLSSDQAHTIAGPGVCILSDWLSGGYNTISGTSMATPHVSGAVARCIASGACAGLSPAQIVSKLRGDAQSLGSSFGGSPTSGTRYYGYLVLGSY